jgi:hypothetical protein
LTSTLHSLHILEVDHACQSASEYPMGNSLLFW